MFGFGAVMKCFIDLAMSGGFSHVENEILAVGDDHLFKGMETGI